MQEPFCSPKGQTCLEEIKVDTSSCLKPCSGLIVTSLSKSDEAKEMETLYPILIQPYNQYKKITKAPTDGLHCRYDVVGILTNIFIRSIVEEQLKIC